MTTPSVAVLIVAAMTALQPQAADMSQAPGPSPNAVSVEAAPSAPDAESSDFVRALDLTGFLRADAFVPVQKDTDPYNFLGTTLMLQLAPSFGGKARAFAETRFIADAATRELSWDLREAYVDLYLGPLDIRVGRQIVVWGRADGVNPTDNVSGKDLTIFSPDEDDRRLGSTALKVDWRLGQAKLTGIVLPAFRPGQPLLPDFPANVTLSDPAVPQANLQNIGGALKLDASLSGIDFSASYYNGFGTMPGIELLRMTPDPAGPPQLDLRFAYDRRQVFGADFAWPVLGLIVRGEAAYTLTDYEKGLSPEIEQSSFFAILGVEFSPIQYLNILLQFGEKIIPDYEAAEAYADPAVREVVLKNQMVHRQQNDHLESLSGRISYSLLQETLKLEVLALYNIYEEDFFIRPKITYALNDAITAILGGEVYSGPGSSLFGQLEQYSSVFAGLKFGF